jgi:hypothetical protein
VFSSESKRAITVWVDPSPPGNLRFEVYKTFLLSLLVVRTTTIIHKVRAVFGLTTIIKICMK